MTTNTSETNFDGYSFLDHKPEGSLTFYEFHQNRPIEALDYHQAYMGDDIAVSALLTPEHQDWVTKAKAIKDRYSCEKARLYVEWDYPKNGELEMPAVFLDFGNWRVEPAGQLTEGHTWEELFLELALASGHEFSPEDVPACPDTDPFYKIAIGFFPARVKDEFWVRVVCNKSVESAPHFAKRLGFSTKWFDKFDVTKHCGTCLISFDVYKDRIEKPAAEMIILANGDNENLVPEAFSEFSPVFEEGHKAIMDAHGEHLNRLRLCHFKVNLTDESYEKGEAKMYLLGETKKSEG